MKYQRFVITFAFLGAIASGQGVRVSTGTPTLSLSRAALAISLPLINSGNTATSDVRVTSINLGGVTVLTPPSLPVSLGPLAPGSSTLLNTTFGSGAMVVGTRYFMSVQGTYAIGYSLFGFTVNRYITVPPIGADDVAATSVATGHNNNARTAANTTETVLTTSNVNSATFGLLGQFAADGQVWGQPLIAAKVGGINLLIFATRHNTLYAYNADLPGSSPVWKSNFGATMTTTNPNLGTGELGCVGTPVIDESNSKIYVVCAGPGSGPSATYTLWQLSLTTGATLNSTIITGSVSGTGDLGQTPADTVIGGNLVFYPALEMQRPALLLSSSRVYVAFGSFDDTRPWHGWVMAYSTTDLSQSSVYCATPNSFGGSFWQAGGGLSADGFGNIYGITSNGNSVTGVGDMSQRYVKFDSNLRLSSSFLDPHVTENDPQDKDFGSGRALLIPGGFVVSAGKDSALWLLRASDMGFLQGFYLVDGGYAHFGGQTYINGAEYITLSSGPIYRMAFNGSTFGSSTISSSTFGYPGAQLSSSSNGANNTIVWALTREALSGGKHPVKLRAFHGTTLAELYQSSGFGDSAKFSAPTVANGKVYAGTLDGFVAVFGLIQPGLSVIGKVAFSGKVSVQ